MSSDNAWYVYGSDVYMIDASRYMDEVGDPSVYPDDPEAEERVLRRYLRRLRRSGPHMECESFMDAVRWAEENYAEYGVWIVEEGGK